MTKIYKFPIPRSTFHLDLLVPMPKGAVPLSVAVQNGELVLYASCETTAPKVNRRICCAMTGEELPTGAIMHFIGTAALEEGAFMIHIYDRGEL